MLQVIVCLALIGLGMGVDATYQRRIRIAECDAYETGYQQGRREVWQRQTNESEYLYSPSVASTRPCGVEWPKKENTIHRQITVPELPPLQPYDEYQHVPSMAAPVAMPPTFEERMKKHGRATWRVER